MHIFHHPATGKAQFFRFLSIIAVSLFLSGAGQGGTINVNFTDTTGTGPGFDGNGILGGGVWNRVQDASLPGSFPLAKNTGAASGVTMNPTGVSILGSSQGNGNLIQNESWYDGNTITITCTGFVPNGFYSVVVYNDRYGISNYTVQGVPKSLPAAGIAPTVLPGIENVDYATFVAKASSGGAISVTGQIFAGIQIQGVLKGEVGGPKDDCMITNSRFSRGGRGRGIFGIRPNPVQSFAQSGRGGASRFYFVNVNNTGAEYDKMFLMAFPDPNTRVTIIDRTTRRNVTASAKARAYRFDLNAGATKGFSVQVASSSRSFTKALNVGIGASPSTLTSSRQDVVTCILTP